MVDVITKKDLLAAKCQALLSAFTMDVHGSVASLTTETRYRRATEIITSRNRRQAVMGDPEYYLEIRHTHGPRKTMGVSGGKMFQALDRFRVRLYYRYLDHDTYANTSQKEFDDACFTVDDTNPGLVIGLGETTGLGTGDDRVTVELLGETVEEDVEPLDIEATEAAHVLDFEIEIEG